MEVKTKNAPAEILTAYTAQLREQHGDAVRIDEYAQRFTPENSHGRYFIWVLSAETESGHEDTFVLQHTLGNFWLIENPLG